MKKTIKVEYAVNEWGLVFPIPIQFWPWWSIYATIDIRQNVGLGNCDFWRDRPVLSSSVTQIWVPNELTKKKGVNNLINGIDLTSVIEDISPEQLIWEFPVKINGGEPALSVTKI